MTGSILLDFLLIIVGFVFLIKGADMLVLGASSLAKRFNVPDIAIGLTIIAMGTSAPELVVNLISGQTGHEGVVFGNIIGSNIFNLYLILGISSVVYPIAVQRSVIRKDVPYCILSMLLFYVMVNDIFFWNATENVLSVAEGLVLLGLFVVFLLHTFMDMRKGEALNEAEEEISLMSAMKTFLYITLGILGLVIGGKVVVDNAVAIAIFYNVSENIIGLTILAGGTSLPELATSVVASYHRKADLAIGNVVGSNIFNILLVLGATAMSSGLGHPLNYDVALNLDAYIMLFGMVLLIVFMYTLKGYKIDRAEGVVFLIGFVAYMFYIYTRL